MGEVSGDGEREVEADHHDGRVGQEIGAKTSLMSSVHAALLQSLWDHHLLPETEWKLKLYGEMAGEIDCRMASY